MIKSAYNRGFTLLEVMLVVSIVGILAALALPNFSYTIRSGRVRTAASDMHTTLLMARSEAIKRNDDVVVSGISGGWQVRYGTQVLYTKNDLPADVQVTCNTDADVDAEPCPASVTFNRAGRPNQSLELRLASTASDAVSMRCVSITLSGQPRVKVDADSNAANGCN